MKDEVKIEIPSAEEILESSKLKSRWLKFKRQVYLNARYIITIVLSVPVIVAVCRYVKFVWDLFF